MPGLSDYAAANLLNWEAGGVAFPALPAVYLGLFTVAPTSDAGTGGTEVSGTGYARPQVGGSLATNGTTASGNAILHFASVPAWIVAGMTVRDATTPAAIPAATTVLSTTGTTVTLSANAAGGGVGNGDTITFSAFAAAAASVGSAPSITPASLTSSAIVTFPTSGSDWGTVVAFGLFDDPTAGHLLNWDYLGTFSWLPATMSAASPGVITATAHGFSAADSVVVTSKYGGTLPTFSQSNLTGILAVVSPATDTFTVTNAATAVNTSSTGDFSVRKLLKQAIPLGIVASFPAASLILYAA
jgi:hypothetical protein